MSKFERMRGLLGSVTEPHNVQAEASQPTTPNGPVTGPTDAEKERHRQERIQRDLVTHDGIQRKHQQDAAPKQPEQPKQEGSTWQLDITEAGRTTHHPLTGSYTADHLMDIAVGIVGQRPGAHVVFYQAVDGEPMPGGVLGWCNENGQDTTELPDQREAKQEAALRQEIRAEQAPQPAQVSRLSHEIAPQPTGEVLRTSKGHEVHVQMTDAQAVAVLRSHGRGQFAASLVQQWALRGLSTNQRPWLHKLANEALQPQEEPQGVDVSLRGLVELLERASKNLKRPKISIDVEGTFLRMSLAGGRSRYPGSVNITDGGGYGDSTWYGRVHTDGRFEAGRSCSDQVRQVLEQLASDPATFAAEYGQRSGSCCFCDQKLTNEESTAVGYGPTCAKNWGLPWGKTAKAQAA